MLSKVLTFLLGTIGANVIPRSVAPMCYDHEIFCLFVAGTVNSAEEADNKCEEMRPGSWPYQGRDDKRLNILEGYIRTVASIGDATVALGAKRTANGWSWNRALADSMPVAPEVFLRTKETADGLIFQGNLREELVKPYHVVCMTKCNSAEILHPNKKHRHRTVLSSHSREDCQVACETFDCLGWSFGMKNGVETCTVYNGSELLLEDSPSETLIELDRGAKVPQLCIKEVRKVTTSAASTSANVQPKSDFIAVEAEKNESPYAQDANPEAPNDKDKKTTLPFVTKPPGSTREAHIVPRSIAPMCYDREIFCLFVAGTVNSSEEADKKCEEMRPGSWPYQGRDNKRLNILEAYVRTIAFIGDATVALGAKRTEDGWSWNRALADSMPVAPEVFLRTKETMDGLIFQGNLHEKLVKPYHVVCMAKCNSAEILHPNKKHINGHDLSSHSKEDCQVACETFDCLGWSFGMKDGTETCTVFNGTDLLLEDSPSETLIELDRSAKVPPLCIGRVRLGTTKSIEEDAPAGITTEDAMSNSDLSEGARESTDTADFRLPEDKSQKGALVAGDDAGTSPLVVPLIAAALSLLTVLGVLIFVIIMKRQGRGGKPRITAKS